MNAILMPPVDQTAIARREAIVAPTSSFSCSSSRRADAAGRRSRETQASADRMPGSSSFRATSRLDSENTRWRRDTPLARAARSTNLAGRDAPEAPDTPTTISFPGTGRV